MNAKFTSMNAAKEKAETEKFTAETELEKEKKDVEKLEKMQNRMASTIATCHTTINTLRKTVTAKDLEIKGLSNRIPCELVGTVQGCGGVAAGCKLNHGLTYGRPRGANKTLVNPCRFRLFARDGCRREKEGIGCGFQHQPPTDPSLLTGIVFF